MGAANLKPNTFAHLNPTTSWVFKQFSRKLFSWQSITVFLLLGKIARIDLINTVKLLLLTLKQRT